MKKIVLLVSALLIVNLNVFAEEMHPEMKQEMKTQQMAKKIPIPFQAVSPDKAVILQEGESKMFCPKCQMALPMFYKTNHTAYVNSKIQQYCSIHCLAETMAEGGKVNRIKVVDNTTLKFKDVISTWYVMGSNKAATMSMISKYAFGKKSDAEKFAKEFGGKVMTFYTVLDSVKSTLEKESTVVKQSEAVDEQESEMIQNN